MRAVEVWVVAFVAVTGCSGAANTRVDTPARPRGSADLAAVLELPRVDDDRAVADLASVPKPAAVVWLDASGAFEVARVDGAWTGTLPAGARTWAATLDAARVALGDTAATTTPDAARDDPPPPPEEDKPDDGSDEAGGTGTAMALDEGKLGPKLPERSDGQATMSSDGDASRPVAELHADQAIVVVATPGASALLLAGIVADESGAIAVSHRGTLAVLARGYGVSRGNDLADKPAAWIELHVGADGVHVVETSRRDQTVVAWNQGRADRDALRAAYTKLATERFAGAEPVVEVRAGPGATAQQLVDVLVTLDGLGATRTSLGVLTGTTEAWLAELAEAGRPKVTAGQPSTYGDLDKAVIRGVIKAHLASITFCYEKQLTAKPGLGGAVMARFFITPSGAVSTSSASGVDPDVAACIAGVIKGITFPAPKGGGGVQVNYPFAFRPAATP